MYLLMFNHYNIVSQSRFLQIFAKNLDFLQICVKSTSGKDAFEIGRNLAALMHPFQ